MIYVTLYLVAIVFANLLSAKFGVSASYFNAFFFIGFDLFARDKLHEAWSKNGLVWKMGLLIACGSLITYALNQNALNIAKASFMAFAGAALVDTVVYQLLHKKVYLVKVNGSNLFSAAVDSLIFPTIAFGGFMPLVVIGQFIVKVLGGGIWSLVWAGKKRQDALCSIGWHLKCTNIDICHVQCPNCKKIWFNNPYWGV